jgi:tRNA-splicing ligase RtcB
MKVIDTERLPIKMWLEVIDDKTLAQARNLANLPFAFKWVALMPDAHLGYGMPIGGVLATEGVVVPNAVGVDIGCGMVAVKTSLMEIDVATVKQVMGLIRQCVPVGFNHQAGPQEWSQWLLAPDLEVVQQQLASAACQLGTLGGGNHFIEIQMGDDGHVWLMIHSGSRNFGLKVAGYYHSAAKAMCARWHSDIPDPDLSFLPLDTREGREYLSAMSFCLDFAHANRDHMAQQAMHCLTSITQAFVFDTINVHHNYAATEEHFGRHVLVHRKGAVKALMGQPGIIPGSMGSPSYIVRGLGNPEAFNTSSHGAGRRMGRKEAIRTLVLEDEQAKMEGVVHGLRTAKDLDEAPGAYKSIDDVMAQQQDLVEVVVKLRPLGSIKG